MLEQYPRNTECFTLHLHSNDALNPSEGTWKFNVNFESMLPQKYSKFIVFSNFCSDASNSNNEEDGILVCADFPSSHNLSSGTNSRRIVLAEALTYNAPITDLFYVYSSNTTTNPPNTINYPNMHLLTIQTVSTVSPTTFVDVSSFNLILTFYPLE